MAKDVFKHFEFIYYNPKTDALYGFDRNDGMFPKSDKGKILYDFEKDRVFDFIMLQKQLESFKEYVQIRSKALTINKITSSTIRLSIMSFDYKDNRIERLSVRKPAFDQISLTIPNIFEGYFDTDVVYNTSQDYKQPYKIKHISEVGKQIRNNKFVEKLDLCCGSNSEHFFNIYDKHANFVAILTEIENKFKNDFGGCIGGFIIHPSTYYFLRQLRDYDNFSRFKFIEVQEMTKKQIFVYMVDSIKTFDAGICFFKNHINDYCTFHIMNDDCIQKIILED